eukprot:13480527-Ditylum_brightwellii.AAC.1
MQLYKALFLEEYKDMLINRNDSMTHQEHDARNSTAQKILLGELFLRSTMTQAGLHKVKCSHLDYEEEDGEKVYTTLTPEMIKTFFRETRGKMNQAMKRWKACGNGARNKKKKKREGW